MNDSFNRLLLVTSFACMACDGDIANEEISLLKDLAKNKNLFGDINIDNELAKLVEEINSKGNAFITELYELIRNYSLSEEQQICLLRVLVKTIQADEKVEYSEIKFFKAIRDLMSISDQEILENIEEIDEFYLEKDIDDNDLQPLNSYFNSINLNDFELKL